MTGTKLIGKKVFITAKDSWACGEWGIVRDYYDGYYYIAIANDQNTTLIFTRSEIKIPREARA